MVHKGPRYSGLFWTLVALLQFPTALSFDEEDPTLPRWDFWPPLKSNVEFTGQYLSSRPNQLQQRKQTFEAIDLHHFQQQPSYSNALLYGNVLFQPKFLALTSSSSSSALSGSSHVSVSLHTLLEASGVLKKKNKQPGHNKSKSQVSKPPGKRANKQLAFDAIAVHNALEFASKHIAQQQGLPWSFAMQNNPEQLVLHSAVALPLVVTGDNGVSSMKIVNRYMDADRQWGHFQAQVTHGVNFYLEIEDLQAKKMHQLAISLDRDHKYNLFQHTFQSKSKAQQQAAKQNSKKPKDLPLVSSVESSLDSSAEAPQNEDNDKHDDKDQQEHQQMDKDEVDDGTCGIDREVSGSSCAPLKPPRILTYNLWNTNPPAEVYGANRRWSAYTKRLDHFVQIVEETRANIIGLQEVRYDGVFGKMGHHAQIQHLMDRLTGFQYVFQPAMSYLHDQNPFERIEEGVAILSKYPILQTDYLLLSRDPNDPNDAHQRVCLHALVDYPHWGPIDVYVTHLSLSEKSREKTLVEIWQYMQQGTGITQVLLGDLNAEPQSRGMRFLRGKEELHGVKADLRDAWLEKHKEAKPKSELRDDMARKFTFPSDNPSKRIDFIFFRGEGVVKECEIIGQHPRKDGPSSPYLSGRHIGMLHEKSPIWASDHRGVVLEFEMND